jgi:hypothetical protein
VIDRTSNEIKAIEAASMPAGEYIEAIGNSDMATWDESAWYGFLECVVTAYTDKLAELNDDVPF